LANSGTVFQKNRRSLGEAFLRKFSREPPESFPEICQQGLMSPFCSISAFEMSRLEMHIKRDSQEMSEG